MYRLFSFLFFVVISYSAFADDLFQAIELFEEGREKEACQGFIRIHEENPFNMVAKGYLKYFLDQQENPQLKSLLDRLRSKKNDKDFFDKSSPLGQWVYVNFIRPSVLYKTLKRKGFEKGTKEIAEIKTLCQNNSLRGAYVAFNYITYIKETILPQTKGQSALANLFKSIGNFGFHIDPKAIVLFNIKRGVGAPNPYRQAIDYVRFIYLSMSIFNGQIDSFREVSTFSETISEELKQFFPQKQQLFLLVERLQPHFNVEHDQIDMAKTMLNFLKQKFFDPNERLFWQDFRVSVLKYLTCLGDSDSCQDLVEIYHSVPDIDMAASYAKYGTRLGNCSSQLDEALFHIEGVYGLQTNLDYAFNSLMNLLKQNISIKQRECTINALIVFLNKIYSKNKNIPNCTINKEKIIESIDFISEFLEAADQKLKVAFLYNAASFIYNHYLETENNSYLPIAYQCALKYEAIVKDYWVYWILGVILKSDSEGKIFPKGLAKDKLERTYYKKFIETQNGIVFPKMELPIGFTYFSMALLYCKEQDNPKKIEKAIKFMKMAADYGFKRAHILYVLLVLKFDEDTNIVNLKDYLIESIKVEKKQRLLQQAYTLLGLIYLNEGDREKAKECFQHSAGTAEIYFVPTQSARKLPLEEIKEEAKEEIYTPTEEELRPWEQYKSSRKKNKKGKKEEKKEPEERNKLIENDEVSEDPIFQEKIQNILEQFDQPNIRQRKVRKLLSQLMNKIDVNAEIQKGEAVRVKMSVGNTVFPMHIQHPTSRWGNTMEKGRLKTVKKFVDAIVRNE